ncbi:GNAT family N-acetyltransferase [Eubacteriales bacterium OttesenSCG-928-M02]|nr:GNAT family N-acetyltransferase [Eubacteriales bacterium OttesenSCG-928-M02]
MDLSQDRFAMRHLQQADLEQFNDLLRYAFQVTEEDLLRYGWEEDEMRQSKFPILEKANVLGFFHGERLASQIAVYPMEMNLHGQIWPMGFLTGVATYPEYAGKGLMSLLMRQMLLEMREQEQYICLLYPFSIPLYRNKGWELISDKMAYTVKDFQLPAPTDVPGMVQRVDWNDPALLALHEEHTKRTHGSIVRNEIAWMEYWRWEPDDAVAAIYYDGENEPKGYLVYHIQKDRMRVKDLVSLNQEAYQGLWNYIAAHQSMVTEVRGSNYTNEPIAFWLPDSEVRETIRPYMMGRIVDVRAFLAYYRFCSLEEEASITFDIRDDSCEWNQGEVTLCLGSGGPAKIVEGKGTYRVSLSIGTLTALLLGYKRAEYLYRIGHMTGDEGAIGVLERAIGQEKPSISDYM